MKGNETMDPRYKNLSITELKSEHKIYSDIVRSRHAQGLEAKFEKRTCAELAHELFERNDKTPSPSWLRIEITCFS